MTETMDLRCTRTTVSGDVFEGGIKFLIDVMDFVSPFSTVETRKAAMALLALLSHSDQFRDILEIIGAHRNCPECHGRGTCAFSLFLRSGAKTAAEFREMVTKEAAARGNIRVTAAPEGVPSAVKQRVEDILNAHHGHVTGADADRLASLLVSKGKTDAGKIVTCDCGACYLLLPGMDGTCERCGKHWTGPTSPEGSQ